MSATAAAPPRDAATLAATAGGRLVAGDPATPLAGPVTTDTRRLRPGDAFLALPGQRFDGGHFAAEAVRLGAPAVIAPASQLPATAPVAIAVEDPRAALLALAQARRPGLPAPVIGVTGSAGKTTTVALLAALLEPAGGTWSTAGSYNTIEGVAATIAGAPPGTSALVAELAMLRRGDIATEAALLRPTAGLIVNVGDAHLDTAGSPAAVAAAKAELLAALPPGGLAVVPAHELRLHPFLRSDLRVVRHGPGGDVSLRAWADGVAEIACPDRVVRLACPFDQAHNLADLVAAVALAWGLGRTPPDGVAVRLPPLRWERGRLGPVELVLDCFNAGPMGVRAALAGFATEPARRRIAVLGPCRGVGAAAAQTQRDIGELAAALGLDVVIAVGAEAAPTLGAFGGEGYHLAGAAEARRALLALGRAGDRALVKGARGAALERIAR